MLTLSIDQATTPLLIIVRVGFGLTHSLGAKKSFVKRSGKRGQDTQTRKGVVINIVRTVNSDVETVLDSNSNHYELNEYKPGEVNSSAKVESED